MCVFVSRATGVPDWAAVAATGRGRAAGAWSGRRGARGGFLRRPHPAVTAVAEVSAATAAAADLSWPPVTSGGDALGATLARACAGASEAAPVDGGTTAALLSVLAAAVAGGASPAVPAAGDRLAALTAVASAIGAHVAAYP